MNDSNDTLLIVNRVMKHHLLPEKNEMPSDRARAKSILKSIGLDYISYHACPKDCVLFRGEYEEHVTCPVCSSSRFRSDVQGSRVPAKILRHFPIIPRIQMMFKCKSIASMMSWHKNTRSTDDIMRVPADSPAWKHIEEKWSHFSEDPRNIRLGIAMDGVNPFGLKSSTWSVFS